MKNLFKKLTGVKPFDFTKPPRKKKIIELNPINYDEKIEKELASKLVSFFQNLIYIPLNNVLKEYNASLNEISNSKLSLTRAIQEGKITFESTGFKSNYSGGKFPSSISKALTELGAVFNSKQKIFEISQFTLPLELQQAITKSIIDNTYLEKSLNDILKEASDDSNFEKEFIKIDFKKSYQSLMNSVYKQLEANASPKTVEDITIPFKVNAEEEQKIAENYTNNLKLTVKDFTDKQIVELRQLVNENTRAGYRPEVLAKKIQERFNVAQNKAMFLASQETSLLTARYTALKYTEGGIVNSFKWGDSFSRIPDEYHKTLYGNIYDFKNLPIIDEKTQTKGLPGERYNCKCRIIPVIEELLG